MIELFYGVTLLVLFGTSAIGGVILRVSLPKEHLSPDNLDAVRLVTTLIVTFGALVLSLQLTTARATFDAASRNRTLYASELAGLDQCLRNLGPELLPARERLRQYTAAVIASTWPGDPRPNVAGMPDTSRMAVRGEDPTLTQIISEIGRHIDAFAPTEPAAVNAAARCRLAFGAMVRARWSVIEDANNPSGAFFTGLVGVWLSLVFLSFGLQVPRRLLSAIVLAIGVVATASVMFVIIDLNRPYGGVFGISSVAMRDALADMSR